MRIVLIFSTPVFHKCVDKTPNPLGKRKQILLVLAFLAENGREQVFKKNSEKAQEKARAEASFSNRDSIARKTGEDFFHLVKQLIFKCL